jgi:hypothetical protein
MFYYTLNSLIKFQNIYFLTYPGDHILKKYPLQINEGGTRFTTDQQYPLPTFEALRFQSLGLQHHSSSC